MNQHKNPAWWTAANETAWDRTKAAFKRDWDQTKHDVGANQPDTQQNITRTINQAVGTEVIPPRGVANYDDLEPAYRFGHGAYDNYSLTFLQWDQDLEDRLEADWDTTDPLRVKNWTEDREAIRHGWDFRHGNSDEPQKSTQTKTNTNVKTLSDLFIAELADMYDAEQRVALALPKMIEATTCGQLKAALEHHLSQSKTHVTKIEQAFKSIGVTAKAKKCEATVGLLKEADEMIATFKNSPALNAAIISSAQRIEHYEIASYGCLHAWATLLKHTAAANLIEGILGDEKKANEKLIELAHAKNQEACGCDAEKNPKTKETCSSNEP